VKNITVSVGDNLYHEARVKAAKRKKSLSALVRDYLSSLGDEEQTSGHVAVNPDLAQLYAMSDRKHKGRRGSAGPLNREELHERGISRH
jgi:hypothetical protein